MANANQLDGWNRPSALPVDGRAARLGSVLLGATGLVLVGNFRNWGVGESRFPVTFSWQWGVGIGFLEQGGCLAGIGCLAGSSSLLLSLLLLLFDNGGSRDSG